MYKGTEVKLKFFKLSDLDWDEDGLDDTSVDAETGDSNTAGLNVAESPAKKKKNSEIKVSWL